MLILQENELRPIQENRAILESRNPELARFFAEEHPDAEGVSVAMSGGAPRADKGALSVFLACDCGRGGNIYLTLLNAAAFCLKHSVSALHAWFPAKRRLYADLFRFNGDPGAGEDAGRGHGLAAGEACLAVRGEFAFFHLQPNPPKAGKSLPDVADWAQLRAAGELPPEWLRAVKALESAFTIKPPDPLPPSVLMIHIRGGDVFTKPGFLGYVQPPLQWYAICIEEHGRRHGRIEVVVVSEDRNNPCVDAVLEWCRERGVEARLQSGTLAEDYRHLMRARALVDSYGSFTAMAKHFNRNLTRVYSFRRTYCDEAVYPVAGCWKDSEERRHTMLALPRDAIAAPDDLYEVSRWEAPVIKADSLPPAAEPLIVRKAGFVHRKTWKQTCLRMLGNIIAAPVPSRPLKKRIKNRLSRW